jgi:hypothetical protein
VIERPLRLDPDALDAAFAVARRHVEEGLAPFTILAVAGWAKPDPRTELVDEAVQAVYAALR